MKHSGLKRLLLLAVIFNLQCSMFSVSAQTIGGHVYGGGNQGNVKGKTTVHVVGGDIDRVFGGARMGNVGGRTYVHIDGASEESDSSILINQLYGGNDIAGTIGKSADALPADLKAALENGITVDWNTLVRISSKEHHTEEGEEGKKTTKDAVYIGSVFAGGNGKYDYKAPDEADSRHRIYEDETLIAFNNTGFARPVLDKTYLEVEGGSMVYAFGGGNNVTVNEKTVIHVSDSSDVVAGILKNGVEMLTDERIAMMGINTGFTYPTADAFQIGSFFGGNNMAEMAIRPTWNLQKGKIRNLYSGGNRGAMTSPEGLLLDIDPSPYNVFPLKIDNIYGGCRMADVKPTVNGVYSPTSNLPGYNFPPEFSARVIVRRGDINNVYGGNDITGTVYGGSAVGIRSSVRGNVYGGGNGGYAYTDKKEDDPVFGDFYFNTSTEHPTTIEALNAFRPNAEQVSIRLAGTAEKPTIVHGSIYVGGNCATLATKKQNPLVELKIGSHVIADSVFLGNNGQMMIDPVVLGRYADSGFSSLDLTDKSEFAGYMEGVCMNLQPRIVFDDTTNGDPETYKPYSSYIGSFFCGGNVGSMAIPGKNVYKVDKGLNIFEKFVGGCNNAYVAPQDGLNAAFLGGVLGVSEEREDYTDSDGNIKDRLEINLENLTMTPLRWDEGETKLIWNTQTWSNEFYTEMEVGTKLEAGDKYYTYTDGSYTEHTVPSGGITVGESDEYYSKDGDVYNKIAKDEVLAEGTKYYTYTAGYYTEQTAAADYTILGTEHYFEKGGDFVPIPNSEVDHNTRLLGANVYGGCYDSGIVNGNIIININDDVLKKDQVFGAKANPSDRYPSGVLFLDQRDDVMSVALTAFGAGYGEETEIWGSTTVNHNKGYIFQIFGGGEEGLIGKKERNSDGTPKKDDKGNYVYVYNPAYSATVNLNGTTPIYSSTESSTDLAETEYIYGGGSEGDVCGNTIVNLGNGRIYDAFAGSSNADIKGHTEVYIGRQPDGSGGFKIGFPWVRDNVYGGNDFGGTVWGSNDFSSETTRTSVEDAELLKASAYVRYIQGRVDTIVGGNYGGYDYTDRLYSDYTKDNGSAKAGFSFPYLKDNSFVHFKPINNQRNWVSNIFAGSEGYAGAYRSNNSMQAETYALIDDTESSDEDRFANMDVYGGGSYAGVGKSAAISGDRKDYFGAGRTVVDLFAGKVKDVYGGCNREGLVGYSRVNVPAESTIKVNAIFGGGKGYEDAEIAKDPYLATRLCDHYVTCINYKGASAIVGDAIYGGNQNSRIACDTYLNIEAPVMQSNGYQATVYGAGYGANTVSGRTNVFMNSGSNAYKVFGGGRDGSVFNYASLAKWMAAEYATAGVTDPNDLALRLTVYRGILDVFSTYLADNPITLPKLTGTYPNSSGVYDGTYTNDILPDANDPLYKTSYHQTNVHIMKGGNVSGYAYGGGYGEDAFVGGTTYIELKGGNVDRDIYGGGQGGHVYDKYNVGSSVFTPATNVYIEGGMCRNAYGGGYMGHVGYHEEDLTENPAGTPIGNPAEDCLAVANVVIGKVNGTSFTDGVPAITRNAYGGGEGGSVFGTSNVTVNNGYIGYRYKNTSETDTPKYEYVEELNDQKPGDLDLSGNVFGGGYVINSYVDVANVNMYGGTIRGSLYGGGEIGPIGRGTVQTVTTPPAWARKNGDATIYKAGQTHVKMFNGHVMRNVFGGGRGKDSWGGDGTMFMDKNLVALLDMNIKGYVFGQTDVNIYGGEVGSDEGLAYGYGNVFGGGDEGSVYSAYEQNIYYTQAEIESATEGDPAYGKTTSDVKTPNVLFVGKKFGTRYDHLSSSEGYYYRHNGSKYVNAAGGEIADNAEKFLTEDCHVLVEPWLQVKTPITYDGHTYNIGDYIPTSYLNTLPKKDKNATSWPEAWKKVDAGSVVGGKYKERGIIIHNAVFAGGNVGLGSELYANTNTVFGNATATVHDVYNRDLITVGGIHIGGLYGDGNLTFVDGYRELNVTNYGTDYYNIKEQIDYDDYVNLPTREQAYYELKYRCIKACKDKEGTQYTEETSVSRDELVVLFDGIKDNGVAIIDTDGTPNPTYWTPNGVVSRYAGRYLNTIQRADFCGVFGSRLVMKGAKDRVPEIEDATNYTINRVREVSLNKKASTAGDVGEYATHGNYFGIYSVVNHLGALTSDLDFYDAVRTTDNKDKTKYEATANGVAYGTATYAQWKEAFHKDPRRNNGLSHNELALASGVYMELTTEESTGNTIDTKEWGIITGIVQLDLINVSKGMGGGFVYAKNIHGVREATGKTNTLLSDLNLHGGVEGARAVTNKIWKYIETDASASSTQKEWQTSGNFVHNSQIIIDDCYNISNRYLMANRVRAHYWYIRGSVYIYDQYITAHTGAASAYSKNEELPITISAAVRNQMKLLDVQPNLYAYYSNYNATNKTGTKLGDEQKLLIQNEEYYLNTPISYWDWSLLPASERNLFVDETYITTEKCKIGETIYPAGTVMLPSEYDTYKTAAKIDLTDDNVDNPVSMVLKIVQDEDGNDVVAKDNEGHDIYVPFESVFHASNDMGHDTGYLLTCKMTNPGLWNTWYTQASSTTHVKSQTEASGWEDGPTYYLDPTKLESGQNGKLLGQNEYQVGAIIPEKTYIEYEGFDANGDGNYETGIDANNDGDYDDEGDTKDIKGLKQTHSSAIPSGQAEFGRAYVVTNECSSGEHHYYKGAPINATEGVALAAADNAAPAYICMGSIQLSATEYVFINDLMTADDITTLKTKYPSLASDFDDLIVPAYYCTSPGFYGGSYYEAGKNYRALETWSSMPESDRENFTFNYDALDLLIDPAYGASYDDVLDVWSQQLEGTKYQYDSAAGTLAGAQANPAHYSLETPLDYTATRYGTSLKLENGQSIKVTRNGAESTVTGDNSESITDGNSIKEDDILEREEYEKLLNEQYHYAPIDVTSENMASPFYVVKTAFYYKEPFAAGQVIDAETYNGLPNTTELNLQANVTTLTFGTAGIYYFCRDSYEIDGTNGTAVTDINNGPHAQNTTVPVGTILNSAEYGKLKNQQTSFTIQGVSPMETTTLYVSRDADYDDLSKEKIITVIYQYDYEESDEEGKHITPISERHVVRIHIKFENGIPTVEDIQEPNIVLPGTSVTMRIPGVTSNGYEIIGGGWELFENKPDAESHFNGKEYMPSVEPLYWYQDEFYLAYYAKTYNRGKTYSNVVPVHVANYHDLKEVMDDKTNHLHVDYDRTRLKRDSKIYINDYSGSRENGLDLLKSFYDLSLLSGSGNGYTVTEGTVTTATGSANANLVGHSLLNNSETYGPNIYDTKTYERGVKGAKNLEFFFRTDIDHSKKWVTNPDYDANDPDETDPEFIEADNPWTPIGSDEQCFHGTVHGDGHTISGLDNSLFYNLCGDVYNLGVKGSFTTAGVVDKGSGYVESCWTSTTGTPSDADVYAVFGNPSRTSEQITKKGAVQIVNSYYQEGKTYKTTDSGDRGIAAPMPEKAYYDGELAYDLNSFYLNKRYYQGTNQSSGTAYKYWPVKDDGTLPTDVSTGYYPAAGYAAYGDLGYVESRFTDGDFRYAAGEIPTSEDERYYEETEVDSETNEEKIISTGFYPLWPDDYIFFGQKLTYGYNAHAHQDVPTAVARDGGRLSQNDDANRVYRAPAYFRSKNMGVAHFNPIVYLAQKSADGTKTAYPGMTAIDFAGHNGANVVNGTYAQGQTAATGGIPALFYPPLLDDDGLISITNCDETENLLVYAPAASGDGYVNAKTHGVLTHDFQEPEYNTYYDNSDGYRLVGECTDKINGHLVQSDLTATNDHMLVDKEEFNCPIAYTFDADHLMWYQRRPADEEYVANSSTGWQGVSLPFTAELVTTHQKGEITHFYSGSANSFNDETGTKKVGHEYWLREFNAIKLGDSDVATAYLRYPDATGGNTKDVTNTFLWDYYYKNDDAHNQKDANADTYLEYKQYYNTTRSYESYPFLTAGTPYILGLPGDTYYEFDLSGKFDAENTAVMVPRLAKQVVTFASKTQAGIAVSDDETSGVTKENTEGTSKDYTFTFKPNYLKETLTTADYALNTAGSRFNQASSGDVAILPFRPYFTASAASKSSGARRQMPTSIVFSGDSSGLDEEGPESALKGTVEIFTRGRTIVTRSHMEVSTTIRIVNAAGATISTFVLEPGKTVETPVHAHGTYIVNRKKIFVN